MRDIAVLRKELRITVPAKVIADHMDHNYAELVHDAFVPGFRKGRAPRRLIEKRFGAEVRQSLTSSIVAQSFFAAVENEKLEVLGDPLFSIPVDSGTKLMDIDEALQHLKLPEAGDFSYVCEVELKPKFELPDLKGIPIKPPQVEVTDAMVDEQILQRRKMRGRVEPVPAGTAEKDDMVIANVALTVDGQEVKREENVTVGVRPAQRGGDCPAHARPGADRRHAGRDAHRGVYGPRRFRAGGPAGPGGAVHVQGARAEAAGARGAAGVSEGLGL